LKKFFNFFDFYLIEMANGFALFQGTDVKDELKKIWKYPLIFHFYLFIYLFSLLLNLF